MSKRAFCIPSSFFCSIPNWQFSFVYENLNWKLFATKAIEPCRIHPQIEPVTDK